MSPPYLSLLLLIGIVVARCLVSTFNIPSSIPISGSNALQHPMEVQGSTSLIYYIHQSQLIDETSVTPILYAYIESILNSKSKGRLTLLISSSLGQIEQMQRQVMAMLNDIINVCNAKVNIEDVLEVWI